VEFPENPVFQKVALSDLDMNRHVNNASYVRWVFDKFSYDFYNQHQIKEVIINYINQLKPEEKYCIAMQETSSDNFNATLYNEEQREVCKISLNYDF
jgi:acyl-ACP thioesterase